MYLVVLFLSVLIVFLKKVKILGSFFDLIMLLKLEYIWKEILEFVFIYCILCNLRLLKGLVLRKKRFKVNIWCLIEELDCLGLVVGVELFDFWENRKDNNLYNEK